MTIKPGLVMVLMAGLLVPQAAPPARQPFKVIGYYAEWTAPRYPLSGIPADKLTHVNYAFAKIGPDSRLTWKAALFNQITALKRKHRHLKFILSVGGWTDSGPFYEMAATDEEPPGVRAIVRGLPEDVSAVRRHRHRLGTSGRRRDPAGPASRRAQLCAAARGAAQGHRPDRPC